MPRQSYKKKKARLPGLERRYAYRSKRRDTPEGVFLEAKGGDKEMIARLGKFGAILVSKESVTPGGLDAYAPWLAHILSEIGRGVSPNEAFGWETPADRWKLHSGESWVRLEKAWRVADLVDRFASAAEGGSYTEAVEKACKLWGVGDQACRSSMTSVVASKNALSRSDAAELALDMISAHGASGYALARETAADYYKELLKSRRND